MLLALTLTSSSSPGHRESTVCLQIGLCWTFLWRNHPPPPPARVAFPCLTPFLMFLGLVRAAVCVSGNMFCCGTWPSQWRKQPFSVVAAFTAQSLGNAGVVWRCDRMGAVRPGSTPCCFVKEASRVKPQVGLRHTGSPNVFQSVCVCVCVYSFSMGTVACSLRVPLMDFPKLSLKFSAKPYYWILIFFFFLKRVVTWLLKKCKENVS